MTRFMWWYLVFGGASLLCRVARWHFGGYHAVETAHSEDARAFGAIVELLVFFALWAGIVSREVR